MTITYSIIAPIYNEKENLPELHRRVCEVMDSTGEPWELILVNGESVDFSHRLRHGERVSVYPWFRTLDVGPVTKVPGRSLHSGKFIADAHLGQLTAYPRLAAHGDAREDEAGEKQDSHARHCAA